MKLPCISLRQPWASAIALGSKTIETRTWRPPPTIVGSRVAIHAAKMITGRRGTVLAFGQHDVERVQAGYVLWDGGRGQSHPTPLPLGAVVATATLTAALPIVSPAAARLRRDRCVYAEAGDVIVTTRTGSYAEVLDEERHWGDFTPGRWGWLLDDVEPLPRPVPARGRQGWFEVEVEVW